MLHASPLCVLLTVSIYFTLRAYDGKHDSGIQIAPEWLVTNNIGPTVSKLSKQEDFRQKKGQKETVIELSTRRQWLRNGRLGDYGQTQGPALVGPCHPDLPDPHDFHIPRTGLLWWLSYDRRRIR